MPMRLKRDKYDKVVSDLVRARAYWTCEKCSEYVPEGDRKRIQCSHIESRGAGNSLRYCTDNCICLCGTCHHYFTISPLLHAQWILEYSKFKDNKAWLDKIRNRKWEPYKWLAGEKDAMYEYYKRELARVLALRDEGCRAPLNTDSWFSLSIEAKNDYIDQ